MLVGYVRVSTGDPSSALQLEALLQAGRERVFTERASARGVDRPQFDAMLAFARDGDTVLAHSMDRLARNLDDLRTRIQSLTKKGIRIEFVKERLAFSGEDCPTANLMLSVVGAFAEFERARIQERRREGVAVARQRGRRRSLSDERVAELCRRVAAGEPKAAIARDLGISRETLYQYLRTLVNPPRMKIEILE